MSAPRQLHLASAGVRDPDDRDLDGVLAGPGQVARTGSGARVSVLVSATWRVEALLAELDARGLGGQAVASGAGATSVRTAALPRLAALAARWEGAGGKRVPADLVLDGATLRLWLLSAGTPTDSGWLLPLAANDPGTWAGVGAALAAAGLPAALVGPRPPGPAYRLTGVRRCARLAELVGPAPPGVPRSAWPQ